MGSYHVVDRCVFQPGQTVNGSYMVRKTLGEGSFGVVYLVDDRYENHYALKLLRLWEVPSDIRKPLIDRFEMEYKTGQIDCSNLVQSVDYGIVGGNPFIVMEFCPGGDLEPLLGKGDSRNSQICLDILRGLNALHLCGKVHRDLKPENVLFKQNGTAALTDFGIAGDRTHRMTQRNIFGRPDQIFGTYAYMPPEQVNRVRGGATVLPTTDIFSFGVLVYQLLTGFLPFGTLESHNDLAKYQIKAAKGQWDRNLLRRLPDGYKWEQLVEGCIVPDFKQRIQSAEEAMRLIPCISTRPQNSQRNLSNLSENPKGFLLRLMQGEEYGKVYNLSQLIQKGIRVLPVGRHADNVLYIKSDFTDYLSRYHCTLELNADQWVIRDGQWHASSRKWEESRNGTFVNSHPVTQKGYYLYPGDIIAIGDVTLRFEFY